MASLLTIATLIFSIILTPFLIFFCGIVLLASIGQTLGVRRLYVKLLLKAFEYGRVSIEKSSHRRNSNDEEDGNGDATRRRGRASSIVCYGNGILPRSGGDGGEKGKMSNGNGDSCVISREDFILLPEPALNNNVETPQKKTEEDRESENPHYDLADVLDYIKTGMEAIIEDQVTSRFEAEQLKSWNLLTRTNRNYEFINWRITVIWLIGFWLRYTFLFPLRVLICFFGIVWACVSTFYISLLPDNKIKQYASETASIVTFRLLAMSLSAFITAHNEHWRPRRAGVCVANHTTPADVVMLSTQTAFSLVMWLTMCTAVVGYVPRGPFKRWLNVRVSKMCFQVLSSALSCVINYHNLENRPKGGSICTANHTSPIDVLILACDNCYSLIGQRHGGFLGVLQRALARSSPHIWFERAEVRDREAVAERIRTHVSDPENPPILIFPEGTCINNTSVMQFKKGSFEVGSIIYPVAIKYDARFGDAFWNSSKYSMMQSLYQMMTSWAIVCDVWYLPPMAMRPDENAVQFANRVKRAIAEAGGLVDLMWDGQLKRMKPKKEWKERQQEEFSKRLKIQ